MIDAYKAARERSVDLKMFLINLVDRFTINKNGLYHSKYLGMNYHHGYLLFLDLICNNSHYNAKEDFILLVLLKLAY